MSRPRFLLGLDLGREVDFSALAVVDTIAGRYDVRRLDRWKPERRDLGDVVHRLADLLEEKPELRDGALAFDATGGRVGRPFQRRLVESSVARLIPVFPIVSTHGWRPANQRGSDLTIFAPKAGLVDVFSKVLEADAFRVADLPLAPMLRAELGAYQQRTGPSGLPEWGARRGSHDDLVAAVVLAVWIGERLRSQGRDGFQPANRTERRTA